MEGLQWVELSRIISTETGSGVLRWVLGCLPGVGERRLLLCSESKSQTDLPLAGKGLLTFQECRGGSVLLAWTLLAKQLIKLICSLQESEWQSLQSR